MNTNQIKEFVRFIDKELTPGVDELEKLSDANRKHVQKLVYTNLVDRFDYVIDKLLMDNCQDEVLVSMAFQGNDQPVTEKELITLLLNSENLQSVLNSKLQDKLRLSVLRKRHSQKLETLLSLCDDVGEYVKKPRINPSTGEIGDSFKVQNKSIPHSIWGYADWLYSRRNAIVHGAGVSKFLDNDRKQIKNLFRVELTKTFKISTASIRNTSKFYSSLFLLVKESG